MANVVEDILAEFGVEEGEPRTVDKATVLRWMECEDLEIKGVVCYILLEHRFQSVVTPPLSFEEINVFVARYFGQCITKNPEGEWSLNRHEAASALSHWIRDIWHGSNVPRSVIAEWKGWLARLYKTGDENVRYVIIYGTLEHAFEDDEVADFFRDWRDDVELKDVYDEALQWKEGLKREPPQSGQ